jgi:nucleotide-binding universal stress UspA family protein
MSEIVVGIDGSEVSRHAVAWAAKEAVLRGQNLKVVHSLHKWLYAMPEDAPNADVGRWARQEARRMLDEAAEHANQQAPGVHVVTELLPGDARPALLDVSADSTMLVVGGRGEGGFAGLLLGSVAHGVAGRSQCTVVIVQGPLAEPTGELVLGVDGSPRSRPAIAAAFTEAAARGSTLRVVHSWQRLNWTVLDAMPQATSGAATHSPNVDEEAAHQVISEAIAGVAAEHPSVKVVEQLVEGHPVHALTQAAEGADLLIVGRRGGGGFANLRLGSVSRGVLHHAPCPVMIVPR